MSSPPTSSPGLAASLLGVLFTPRRTLARLALEDSAKPGASAIALLALFWSVLLVWLWMQGHAPAFVLLPIPLEHYYLAQALVMLPVLTGLWWVHAELSHRLATRAGGEGREPGVRAALGFAYAAPMLAHVLAELAATLAGGVDALRLTARISLPAASLAVWVLSSLALRVAHRTSWPASVGAAFAGLLVQALLGALVLR
ncbi:MAG: hypothetical protein RLP09_12410 [Sandaracinaceae bacterium]